jgi:hypothetical protein
MVSHLDILTFSIEGLGCVIEVDKEGVLILVTNE